MGKGQMKMLSVIMPAIIDERAAAHDPATTR
jgi:hypothetical protein